MRKFLFKTLVLTVIVGLLAALFNPILKPNWNTGNSCFGRTTTAYLAQPDQSIDVLFLGSSQILRGLDTAAFREEYGIAAYTRATAVQFPAVTYYYLKEALEHHDIKVVVSDFSNLYMKYDPDEYEPYLRYAFDYMPLSADKIQAIRATTKDSEEQDLLSYMFPFLRYHSRWRELTMDDITWPLSEHTDNGYGSIICDDVVTVSHQATVYAETAAQYEEESLYWYEKVVQLCEENNVELILLRMPRETWDAEQATADLKFAEKYNLTFYDLNSDALYADLGFNDQTDYMDPMHLNATGAKRITAWLANIIEDKMAS